MYELEVYEKSGRLIEPATDDEDRHISKIAIESVLSMCTQTQRRRFDLYHNHGYTYTEIAKMENCDAESVRKSVKKVFDKIKNIF